jgi:PiT family inorganic phosphate transporter
MGLIMLILIGVLPGAFALQSPSDPGQNQKTIGLAQQAAAIFQSHAATAPVANPMPAPTQSPAGTDPMTEALKPKLGTPDEQALNEFVKSGKATSETFAALSRECGVVAKDLAGVQKFEDLPDAQREAVRKDIYLMGDSAVKFAVALALGIGTMVGWKRVVVTVGEKIGKAHLTYAQGGAAEVVAFITILGAGLQGWPVSTTHVLSSGIAGTMAANRSGLQKQTLINIVLAWVLTLPVCVFLGATLFSAALYVVFHFFGIHS